MITISISNERAEEIAKYARLKKMTGNWIPEGDPIDWLALEVVRALVDSAHAAVPAQAQAPEDAHDKAREAMNEISADRSLS